MYLWTVNPLKFRPFCLNVPLNLRSILSMCMWTFFLFNFKSCLLQPNVHLYPQTTLLRSSMILMCISSSNHSMETLHNSNVNLHPWTIQIKSSSIQNAIPLSNHLNQASWLKCAIAPSNHSTQSHLNLNAPLHFEFTKIMSLQLKWSWYPQMCTIALSNLKSSHFQLKWP